MYRVNSVFTANTLPNETKNSVGDEGFYQKDGKSYQIDPNSEAFKAAFIDAHVKNTVAAQNILLNFQDTQNRVAQNKIEEAQKKLSAVLNADVLTEEARARGARNALISRILLLADDICLQHKANIQGNAIALNLSLGTATTLFAGAASLATGSGAQTLSALAAASSSTRSLVGDEVYQKAFASSILLAIDSDRSSKKTPIIDGMKSTTADYPIELAIQQINEYHQSCSFINGIEVISKAVQQRPKTKAQIQSEIDYLRGEMTRNSALDINNADLKGQLTKLQALHLDALQ